MQPSERGSGRRLAFAVVDGSPSLVCVRVTGEADLATAPELETALLSQLDGGRRPHLLEVDLSELSFLDARGVAALLRVVHAAAQEQCRVRLRGARPHVRRVLEITGVPSACEVC